MSAVSIRSNHSNRSNRSNRSNDNYNLGESRSKKGSGLSQWSSDSELDRENQQQHSRFEVIDLSPARNGSAMSPDFEAEGVPANRQRDRERIMDIVHPLSRISWRRKAIEILMRKQCNLEEIFKNVTILSSQQKASGSASIIILAKFKDVLEANERHEVVIKVSFRKLDSNLHHSFNNSLKVERQVYQNIISYLLSHNHSPNFMAYLGTYNCNNLGFTSKHKREFETELNSLLDNNKLDTNMTKLLVLERSNGVPYSEWLKDKNMYTKTEKYSVIFQILYAINCMVRIGMRHNDLHAGNIFIEDLFPGSDRSIDFIFYLDNRTYIQLPVKYLPKIYDFDRASVIGHKIERNIELDHQYCSPFGQCNGKHDKFDLFTFAYWTNYFDLAPNFINAITDKTWLEGFKELVQYPALLRKNFVPKENKLKSIQECINIVVDQAFERKRNNPPANIVEEFVFKLPEETVIEDFKPNNIIPSNPLYLNIRQKLGKSSKEKRNQIRAIIEEYFDSTQMGLFRIWAQECKEMYNYDVKKKAKVLFMKFIKKKDLDVDHVKYYAIACYLLSLPMWYCISINTQKYILQENIGHEGTHFIGDIWHIFNNVLPITMPRL